MQFFARVMVWLRSLLGRGGNEEQYSIVLLLDEPRRLDAAEIVAAIRAELGIKPTIGTGEEERTSEHHLAVLPDEWERHRVRKFAYASEGNLIAIIVCGEPYASDTKAWSEEIPGEENAAAAARHRAWISVDHVLIPGGEPRPTRAGWQLMGRVAAALCDEHVIGIFTSPEQGFLSRTRESFLEALRTDDPVAAITAAAEIPIMAVDSDDPRMVEAVAEARRRWPEFVERFRGRASNEDSDYFAKAPFGPPGQQEFMWVRVLTIDADVISGRLENAPAEAPDMSIGDEVSFPVGELNDWLIVADAETIGGFTLKALMDAKRRVR